MYRRRRRYFCILFLKRREAIDPGLIITYHVFVAAQKKRKKEESQGSQAVVIFWFVFIIAVISVFMFNADTIKKNFNIFKTQITAPSGRENDVILFDDDSVEIVIEQPDQRNTTDLQTTPPETVIVETEPVTTPTATLPIPVTPEPKPPASTQTQTQTPPVQTRDRTIYFAQVNSDGQILQSKVTRRIPVSQSPMLDSLNSLLAGPSAEELKRGMLNLIPRNTRILSTMIRGSTAYISFSEDFLFNTFGVEGYVAQLRQIVWTVTEFSNVSDVQILVEGRRLDYLGEGIWIGSPISRQSF